MNNLIRVHGADTTLNSFFFVGHAVHTHFYEFPEFPYPPEFNLADTDLPDGPLVCPMAQHWA